jgi:hypothetical protein
MVVKTKFDINETVYFLENIQAIQKCIIKKIHITLRTNNQGDLKTTIFYDVQIVRGGSLTEKREDALYKNKQDMTTELLSSLDQAFDNI